jgi:hypothetical protein
MSRPCGAGGPQSADGPRRPRPPASVFLSAIGTPSCTGRTGRPLPASTHRSWPRSPACAGRRPSPRCPARPYDAVQTARELGQTPRRAATTMAKLQSMGANVGVGIVVHVPNVALGSVRRGLPFRQVRRRLSAAARESWTHVVTFSSLAAVDRFGRRPARCFERDRRRRVWPMPPSLETPTPASGFPAASRGRRTKRGGLYRLLYASTTDAGIRPRS